MNLPAQQSGCLESGLEPILEALLEFMRGNFDARLPVGALEDPLSAVHTAINITGEELGLALAQSRRFEGVLAATPDFVGMARADDHRVLYVNSAGRRMVGLGDEADVTGLRVEDFHPESSLRVIFGEGLATVQRGEPWNGEVSLRHRDGREIVVSMVMLGHVDAAGHLRTLSTISRRLDGAAAAQRAVLTALPDLVFKLSRTGVYLDVYEPPEGASTILPRERIIGRSIQELLPQALADRALESIDNALDTGRVQSFDMRIDDTAGRRDYEVRVVKARQHEVFAVVRDVTERIRADRDVQRLAAIVESSTDAIIGADLDGTIRTWNPAAERIFGFSAREVVGEPLFPLMPEDRRAEAREMLGAICRGEDVGPFETVRMRKDGTTFDASLNMSLLRDRSGTLRGVSAIVRDITAKKRIERRLDQFSVLLEATSDFVGVATPDGEVIYVNGSGKRMIGLPKDASVNSMTLADFHAPQVLSMLAHDAIPMAMAHGTWRGEAAFVDRSGQSIPVSMVIVAHRDPAGRPDFIATISRDISEQKRTAEERDRTLAELRAAHEQLESFSYSVSHDLKAPLRIIDSFSADLLEQYAEGLGDEARSDLERIRNNALRMSALIDGMLELSRLTRGEMHISHVNVSEIALEVLRELREAEPAREIAWRIEPNLVATGDPRLIEVVLRNLLHNAWKFTAHRPRAQIEIGCILDDGTAGRVFFVRDDGAGFDMTYADDLFSPFTRLHTEEEFEGTGIGLATVQRIVHRHGGRAWAEAKEGEGATFFFTLPSGRLA